MSLHDDELRALLNEGRAIDREVSARHMPTNPRERDTAWSRMWRASITEPAWDAEERVDDLAGRRGRAAPTLQATWIDPEETPFVPQPRPGRALPARLFSMLLTAAVIGLLAWLIVPEVSFRVGNVNNVQVRDGVLTAQGVPLAPTVPATVEKLYVDAGSLPSGVLPAGTPIARLRTATPDAFGVSTVDLSVPFDARFVSVDTLQGAVTEPGTPVATVYDPRKMYVIVTVAPGTLDRLRRGMHAKLTSPLISGSIDATVVSAVPMLGNDHDPASSELVHVRIQPKGDRILDLVPGIHFDAVIDLSSAPKGAQPLVVTAADTVEGGPAKAGVVSEARGN